MNAITKISAFPATVQPGIPALSAPPTGWSQEPLGRYLEEVRRPVALCDSEDYELVTAKRARGGIVHRETLKGRDISVKSQFRLKEGDFLISKRQIVHGACGFVPRDLEGAVVSNEYAVLRCRPGLDPHFLNYLSHTIHFQQTCFHSSIGVHVEKMIFKLERWLKWNFNLPPLAEQKKIAEVLATWDRAITTMERLLTNAGAQKRALMQQLLTGKRRLPGYEQHGWKLKRLGELATIRRGASPRPIDDERWFAPSGRGWVRISDVTSTRQPHLTETSQYLSAEGVSRSVSVDPGELIMSICATIGVPRIVGIPVCIHDGFVVFQSHQSNLETEFLYFYLQFKTDELAAGGQPGTQRNLNTKIVGDIEVPCISLNEQRAIATILRGSEQTIFHHERELKILKNERHALMQQLLTGKRRVTV